MDNLQLIILSILPYLSGTIFLVLSALLIWTTVLAMKIRKINKKNKEFFSGNKVKNLEELLLEQARNLKLLDKDIQELYNISNQINKLAFLGFHKIGLVRFNPFKDVGGNQSFSFAILNGKNNGLVVSSLYTREGARVYSKNVTGGKAEEYPFTEEEKKAIEKAINLGKIDTKNKLDE